VRSTSFLLGVRETYWREHVRNLLRGMNPHLPPTFVLDPITAHQFVVRGGFDTVDKLSDWVHDNATMSAKVFWDYQLIENYRYPRALNGVEPYATILADHGVQLQRHRLCRRVAVAHLTRGG